MHAIARSLDDRALFHPVRTVAGRGRGVQLSLPAREITMAEMLRDAGYATAMFGKWHLGDQTYSQPQNKGFDEFYGIRPATPGTRSCMIPQGRQTKTLDIPLDKGPQIVEAKRGEPLKAVKPYTEEVRRDIDWELVDRGHRFHAAPERRPASRSSSTCRSPGRTFRTCRRSASRAHRASASSAIP